MSKFTQKAKDKSLGNNKVIGRMMIEFNRHSKTIERWINDGADELSSPATLDIIKQETGLSEIEILEQESINEAVQK